MKLLLDANLSPRVARALRSAIIDATYVGDHQLLTASDDEILDWAADRGHVVNADSDFGMLLAFRRTASPSIILLRDVADESPDTHEQLLIENLPQLREDLDKGAITSLSRTRLRVRALPIE